MVIGLFPELEAPGGIQRVGRHVGAVTAAWAAERGEAWDCFEMRGARHPAPGALLEIAKEEMKPLQESVGWRGLFELD